MTKDKTVTMSRGPVLQVPRSLLEALLNADSAEQHTNIDRELRAILAAPVVERQVQFSCLCYGAKFKYSADEVVAWVKIGHDLIARWDASKVADTWIGQPICSFSEDGDLSRMVCLLDSPPAPVAVALDPCTWTDRQILDFIGVALRNVDPLGSVVLNEIRQGFEYMRDQVAAIDKVKELNQ